MPHVPASADESEIRFGRIVSTTGASISALLDGEAADRAGLQLGALVKIRLPRSTVYGLVGELKIPAPQMGQATGELRLAEIHLLGEVSTAKDSNGNFRRGVSRLPSLDDVIVMADEEDVRRVYALPGHETVTVGTIHQSGDVPAQISVDEMLGKHFAVLGTTGTGKSCAVTLILKQVLIEHPNAHVLMLDPHGEYSRAFGPLAHHLDVGRLTLPYWMFNFEEFVQVVFGDEAPQRTIEIQYLRQAIVAAKRNYRQSRTSQYDITADTPIPFSMGELERYLDNAMGKLENQSELSAYLRIKLRLNTLRADRRFAFMFPPGLGVTDSLADLVGSIFRVPVNGKPLAVLDLAGVPSEILNVVVSVLARMAFDVAFCSDHQLPILLVCEEAHRYAPQSSEVDFDAAKRALSKIAKEGRKYGLSLCIVTQRPSELDQTILSQCSTVFALRMTNRRDQAIIEASLSEYGADLLSALPVLGTAEAIATGEGVPVPMRLRFARLPDDEQPRSASGQFTRRWRRDEGTTDFIQSVIGYWRHHTEEEPHAKHAEGHKKTEAKHEPAKAEPAKV